MPVNNNQRTPLLPVLLLFTVLSASFLFFPPDAHAASAVAQQALQTMGQWSRGVVASIFLILMSMACVLVAYNHRMGLMVFATLLIIFLILFLFLETFVQGTFVHARGGGQRILPTVVSWVLIGCFALMIVAGLVHIGEMSLTQGRGLISVAWVLIAFILFAALFRGHLLGYFGYGQWGNVNSTTQIGNIPLPNLPPGGGSSQPGGGSSGPPGGSGGSQPGVIP